MASRNVYTVKQVNYYIKRIFEEDGILRNIYITGEISNCKYHHSGHIYFSLKDESGVIPCVMFASNANSLRFRLSDGLKVILYGSISVYEKSGSYQLYVRSAEEAGKGDLYRQFEELKKRLEESGMFAAEYKQPIPDFSMNIGVVTAKTGAVIRDIYNVASRRNPYCRITLYPATVQGEGAAGTIIRGIQTLDELGLDCIIVGRGGGSMEDLWCFNDEELARAIFNCRTPVISAVGHETDFTIADFAADLRAPTPSAAAELAVFDYNRFLFDLDSKREKLSFLMENKLRLEKAEGEKYRLEIGKKSPKITLENYRQRLSHDEQWLKMAMDGKLSGSRAKSRNARALMEGLMKESLSADKNALSILSERLEGLSPLLRLSQGYSYVSLEGGRPLKSISQIKKGDLINIDLRDGRAMAEVKSTEEKDNA